MLEQVLALLLEPADLRGFVELGGPVFLLVLVTGLWMWLLLIERMLYLAFGLPRQRERLRRRWQSRPEHRSWQSRQIRRQLLAELALRTAGSDHLVRSLIQLAPLLGLLGTVTGMLDVFEVMAQTGTGNARAMAAGISRATLPTLAGMVMALSGLYAQALLASWARRGLQQVRFQVLTQEGQRHAPA